MFIQIYEYYALKLIVSAFYIHATHVWLIIFLTELLSNNLNKNVKSEDSQRTCIVLENISSA